MKLGLWESWRKNYYATVEHEAAREKMCIHCAYYLSYEKLPVNTCPYLAVNAFIPLFFPLQLPVALIWFSRHILISFSALGLHIPYLQPFATYLCPSCTAPIFSASHSWFQLPTSSLHSSGSLLTPVTVQCCNTGHRGHELEGLKSGNVKNNQKKCQKC